MTPRRKIILASCLLAVCLVAWVLWAALQPRKASAAGIALDRKLAELRARGEPLTTDQLAVRFPDPPPDRDAQTILRSALAFTPAARPTTNVPVVSAPMPARLARLDTAVMRDLEAHLGSYTQLVAAIPDDLSGVRFSVGWSNGLPNLGSLPLLQLRTLFQTLSLTALYTAEGQDMSAAAETLRKGFAVTHTINDELMVNAMIRVACVGLLCDATEQVLNRGRLTEEQLARIASEVNSETAVTLTNALRVERYMGVQFLDLTRMMQTNGLMSSFSVISIWNWMRGQRGPDYRDEDYLLFLEFMDARIGAAELSGFAEIKRNDELDLHYKTRTHSWAARFVMNHLTKALKAQCEVEAKVVTLQAAIAIERHRLAHNTELPSSLDILAPKYLPVAPRDPFDGKPLRFKKLPLGYVVYSVGSDGVDNGGTERANLAVTNNYDITFTVER